MFPFSVSLSSEITSDDSLSLSLGQPLHSQLLHN